jgi:hypothetical protein
MQGFEKPGKTNTEETLRLAGRRGGELGIGTVLVATTSGRTALMAADILGDRFGIVAVTHCAGFSGPNEQELSDEAREDLLARGIRVHTATHAFGTFGRAVRRKFGTYELEEIAANVLRRFGEGTKVAVEIALMAADAGLVRTDEDVISIGGTGQGADTALVLRPANTQDFFDLKVREIICKPFDV